MHMWTKFANIIILIVANSWTNWVTWSDAYTATCKMSMSVWWDAKIEFNITFQINGQYN